MSSTRLVDLDVKNRKLGIPSRAQQAVARAFLCAVCRDFRGCDVVTCVCLRCRWLKVVRVCVLGHFLLGVLTCAVSLCVSGAVRRDFDVCVVAACVFVSQSSEICAHAVSLRVQRFRALVAAPFLSFESCMCVVHVCACSQCSQLRVVRVRCFLRAVD